MCGLCEISNARAVADSEDFIAWIGKITSDTKRPEQSHFLQRLDKYTLAI
jgi:hypothetical protein